MAKRGMKTLAEAFESGPADKEPKGMKEGSKAEEALDKKQFVPFAKKAGKAAPMPFPPAKKKGK